MKKFIATIMMCIFVTTQAGHVRRSAYAAFDDDAAFDYIGDYTEICDFADNCDSCFQLFAQMENDDGCHNSNPFRTTRVHFDDFGKAGPYSEDDSQRREFGWAQAAAFQATVYWKKLNQEKIAQEIADGVAEEVRTAELPFNWEFSSLGVIYGLDGWGWGDTCDASLPYQPMGLSFA